MVFIAIVLMLRDAGILSIVIFQSGPLRCWKSRQSRMYTIKGQDVGVRLGCLSWIEGLGDTHGRDWRLKLGVGIYSGDQELEISIAMHPVARRHAAPCPLAGPASQGAEATLCN
jgi:hypothetical protein